MKIAFKLCLLFFFLLHFKTYSTHIVGGEMKYRQLAGNNYEITLNLYRDCYNGIPPFDNPAFITIFNSGGNVITAINLSLLTNTIIALVNYSPDCVMTPTDVCVEKGTYCDTVNLPPIVGGYAIVYQRCCRSATVLNIVNPSETGATYSAHIPGSEIVATNSSPDFIDSPPFYFCNNKDITYEHFAIDNDGDSLVYFLSTPYNGLDICCPIISPGAMPSCANPPANCPSVNPPPQYQNIIYNSPFNTNYPISSSPAISINSSYGLITLTPNLTGDFAISVGVNEYRNHVLIGTHYRDFHTKVVNCSVCTKTEEHLKVAFTLFPNPANDYIVLNVSDDLINATYEITDVFGKIILKETILKTSERINHKDFSKGLYFLKVTSKNGNQSKIEKLIIE